MSAATPVTNIPAESESSPAVYDKNNMAKKDFSEAKIGDAIATEKPVKPVTGKRGRQPSAAKKQTRKQKSESANVMMDGSFSASEDGSAKEAEPTKEAIEKLMEPIVSEPIISEPIVSEPATPGTSESIEGKALEGLTILSESDPTEDTMEVPQNVDIDNRVVEPTVSEPMTPEVNQTIDTQADVQEPVEPSVEQSVDQAKSVPESQSESQAQAQAEGKEESAHSPMENDNDNKDETEEDETEEDVGDVDFPMTQVPMTNTTFSTSNDKRHDVTPASSQE